MMDQWKLWLFHLLPLCLCFSHQETVVKTISREPDFTPICTNSSTIIHLMCKIRTKMSRGEECRLMYHHVEDFVNECDSRFTLLAENQTVFLRLTSLKPADSGNYTCECSYVGGIDTLHLDITVDENRETEQKTNRTEETSRPLHMLILRVLVGVTAVIVIITGVIFGFICSKICQGCWSRSVTSGLSASPGSLDEDDPDDPYTSLQQPANDLYQTVPARNTERFPLYELEIDVRETDPSWEIYENI